MSKAILTEQIKRQFEAIETVLTNLSFFTWDGTQFVDLRVPIQNKAQRAVQNRELNFIQSIYQYILWLQSDDKLYKRELIEQSFEEAGKRLRQVGLSQGILVDQYGFSAKLGPKEKLRQYDLYEDNFIRRAEHIGRILGKIKTAKV